MYVAIIWHTYVYVVSWNHDFCHDENNTQQNNLLNIYRPYSKLICSYVYTIKWNEIEKIE